MEGLYKKVIRGKFTHIQKSYTFELHHLIDLLLQVDPAKRPSCGINRSLK